MQPPFSLSIYEEINCFRFQSFLFDSLVEAFPVEAD